MNSSKISRQRAIIDRRKVSDEIDGLANNEGSAARTKIISILRDAMSEGQSEIAKRLKKNPSAGHQCIAAQSFLTDQLLRLIYDYVTNHIYPVANRSSAERIAVLAVGGYGRAEMAPHSDIDIAFITPTKRAAWCEQTIEAILYCLWDLGLKVGQSSRTVDETMRMAKADLTIRTALLESRFVWGDRELFEETRRRFWLEVAKGSERQFLKQKLEERDNRHKRMGDSRYVVEPNIKEGKGGLRDLQTLYWIGKYIHRVRSASELVEVGLLTSAEYSSFRRAEGFLLAVRSHMHLITGRAEDRLTFDLQREVAKRMKFADRTGKSAVERFMQFYFIQAKRVGSLTGVFLAHLDDEFAKSSSRAGFFAGWKQKTRTLKGYQVFAGRIAAPSEDWFKKDPVRLIEVFQLAEANNLEVHPDTMRLAARDSTLIKSDTRNSEKANSMFLALLSGRNNPEMVLRWMNEAGVFGRFIPDFGRVNAQMQFDMYHHYTVDEHTIRAIGLLSRIEKGELKADHPRSTHLIHRINSRQALYVAVLLHDIAKGRGGDHSILGAEVAEDLCPRLGLNADETNLVSWLVRYHLLMSATAFKRDLTDPKTIEVFIAEVQSLERLRNLTILTAVDIRAVGPGTWNGWKGQLLGDLYDAAQEQLRLGHMKHGREKRISLKKEAVSQLLGDGGDLISRVGQLFDDSYWIAEHEDMIARNLVQYNQARKMKEKLSIDCEYDQSRSATLVSVIAADHPGLFFRIAGGIALAGANIIDARIHTTRTGYAVDNFLVQNPHGKSFAEGQQLARLKRSINDALANKGELVPKLAARPLPITRAGTFKVAPRVTFDNNASNRFTVIEVNARDRPALLNRLARALFEANLIIQSAHITAYGERAADTFYVTDLLGTKISSEQRLKEISDRLVQAASDEKQKELEEA